MKKLHTALCVCALVLVCILVLPTRAEAAIVDSGTCGYHLSWKLDSSGTLTISGSGTMTDWFWSSPWYDNDAIKTVVIKNGVTTIGDYAFNSCCNLTSVTIPNTVTAIGASAFYDCDSLASITIPDSVTTIGDSAFGTCNGLTRVSITDLSAWCKISFGNHLSNPMYYADTLYLNGAKPSGAIKIANGVTAIPAGTFRNCTGLTSLTIPDSVASIGDSAFYDCARLNKVTMGNSVTTIGDSAFYDCDSLTSVAIPNSVTTIGDSVFYDCDGLTKVTIPDSVTAIGNYAFCDCDSLTGVTIPNSITIIENMVFFSCDSLTSVTIPNSVTTIDYGAFGNCSNLIGVTIPDSVTTIGEGAFRRCASLQYVVMGSAMDMVDEDAFYNCSNLRHVLFRGNRAQKDYLLFKNGNDYIKNATWHLNATGKEVTTEQFCNQTYAYCTICKCYLKGDPSTASHVYDDAKDGTCNICGQTRVRITKQPASVVVANGKTAKVTVSAAGEGLTYKWYYKNKGASKFSLTTTFTGNTYSVAMNASRSGRQVYCVITDKYGNTVKTNTVTLKMK